MSYGTDVFCLTSSLQSFTETPTALVGYYSSRASTFASFL